MSTFYEKECVRLNDQVRKQQRMLADLHGDVARLRQQLADRNKDLQELENALAQKNEVVNITIGGSK